MPLSPTSNPPPHQKATIFSLALRNLLQPSSLRTSLDVLTLVDLIVDYGEKNVQPEYRIDVLDSIRRAALPSFFEAWSISASALRLTKLWLEAALSTSSTKHHATQVALFQLVEVLPPGKLMCSNRHLNLTSQIEAASQGQFIVRDLARDILERWNSYLAANRPAKPPSPPIATGSRPGFKRKLDPSVGYDMDASPTARFRRRLSAEGQNTPEFSVYLPQSHDGGDGYDALPNVPLNLEEVCDNLQPNELVEHVEAAMGLVRSEQFQWSENHHSGMSILLSLLLKIVSTKTLYQHLLSLQGEEALTMLNSMQLLLDFYVLIDQADRRSILKALLRLSDKSGLYPECLTLQRVEQSSQALDEGSYGEVYRGRFEDQNVALKMFKVRERSDISKILKAVWKEAILWSQLSHDNLLPFYGVYHLGDQHNRVCLVSPWMEMGNVVDYLRGSPRAERPLLLSDIASGIAYLHECEVIHGDLKGANILVSISGRACLADFGLSKVSDPLLMRWTSVNTVTTTGGTLRWQAPELFTPEDDGEVVVTTKSDIYSFACVCYEIMTGHVPFYQVSQPFTVIIKVMGGARPSKPLPDEPAFQQYGLSGSLWDLMGECWQQDPEDRPTAAEILHHPVMTSLVDRRQPQQWGSLSASQFRRSMTMLSGITPG
ncbi:kinase-like domain-containing protein [Ephemerocybe angulata]|uniref:Kinase-like domain-containing protein n=1 Tax=Ephemerocybe angulata TaxID=980116 RepID=A0A8H6M702_9AGAR|nr:kinase-like domain-containing protein [Tulosesus angulatus]